MYLHIGDDMVIPLQEIVAILQAEALAQVPEGQPFLTGASRPDALRLISGRRTNSYVVTESRTYASHLSAATLRRRALKLQARAVRGNSVAKSGENGPPRPRLDPE